MAHMNSASCSGPRSITKYLKQNTNILNTEPQTLNSKALSLSHGPKLLLQELLAHRPYPIGNTTPSLTLDMSATYLGYYKEYLTAVSRGERLALV